MIRTVLVHVNSSPQSEARTRFAISLAKAYGASLVGVTANLPQVPMEMYAGGIGIVGAGMPYADFDRKQVEAEFGKVQRAFTEAVGGSGVEHSWRAYFETPSAAVAYAATAADILVIGPEPRVPLGDASAASPGDIVLRVGRPVLVVPEEVATLNIRNVLIAWKDTTEAQRAIADALPFLKRAGSVGIVAIKEGASPSTGLDDAVAFLKAHEIAARAKTLESDGKPVHQQLLDIAASRQTDLIVAGAYGRSRLLEWVFGGVTRGLLTQSPITCLLSH